MMQELLCSEAPAASGTASFVCASADDADALLAQMLVVYNMFML